MAGPASTTADPLGMGVSTVDVAASTTVSDTLAALHVVASPVAVACRLFHQH